jgi:hypothetical protein
MQEGRMGFDLWTALGISQTTGLALGVAGIAFAGLLALRIYVGGRRLRATPRGLSLSDPPR